MFEKFTESGRQVVVVAQDEARSLRHNYIGTEHLLLGLLREDGGIAREALDSLTIELAETRAEVGRIIGSGDEVARGEIPFTPRAKRVLELALRESLALGDGEIAPEHILLGLVREGEGVGARILRDAGADAFAVRQAVMERRPADSERASAGEPAAPRRSVALASPPPALLAGVASAVAGLGAGILLGWAIWG